MEIHHLNCGTMCPRVPQRLIGNTHMVCHCLLIESVGGLVLVETGLGRQDHLHPFRRLGMGFAGFLRPSIQRSTPAIDQVEAMGFNAADVRHIVVTHLDVDHAGGIPDFPDAQVHVHALEHRAAMNPSWRDGLRYYENQWAHGPQWVTHDDEGEAWHGFRLVRPLIPSIPEIALVPLFGHSPGHCGVAVQTASGWLLHAGDAYFHHAEMQDQGGYPPGLRLFQAAVQTSGSDRHANQARLRALAADPGDVTLFCAHDLAELDQARGAG